MARDALTGDRWRLTGTYLSVTVPGSARDAACALINLVNVQGAGPVRVEPREGCRCLEAALDALDARGGWRAWWYRESGERVSLTDSRVEGLPVPLFRCDSTLAGTGRCLGINTGGTYLRRVWLDDGNISAAESVRRGGARRSPLPGLERLRGVRQVGIARIAARTRRGLTATPPDEVLGGMLGCPVRSWNDGEAIAAAEAVSRPPGDRRAMLVLKLGTSMAGGIVAPGGVCGLPLQLARCIPSAAPISAFEHPRVKLRGTVRDLVGAGPMTDTYRLLTGRPAATYAEFTRAAVKGDPEATRILMGAAAAITDVSRLMSSFWSPMDVVVTGRSLRNEAYRGILHEMLAARFGMLDERLALLEPAADPDLGAAVGAVVLTWNNRANAVDR